MTERRDKDFHERREDAVSRLKGAFADVPASRVLSEELIAERREEAERDFTEEEWLRALSSNPAFAFLDDPKEDVYGPEDGKPYRQDPGSPEG